MPIYEFYCDRCNTIYNFFSKRINTETIPRCPSCKTVKLQRRMSVFATISADRRGDDDEGMDEGLSAVDEQRMERAMAMLARESEGLDEENPRQAAQLMRKLADSTGLELNPEMQEALSRIERGEDPDKIEEDLGDLLTDENPFIIRQSTRGKGSKKPPPRVDETLYDLE
ncbi:MAG TPA: zinc ribbon domain-containing protein [Deltaproteobacteria bacterium]|nr:zinc ribbon domain-containing protein [Deltaproteobacteria bacterium]